MAVRCAHNRRTLAVHTQGKATLHVKYGNREALQEAARAADAEIAELDRQIEFAISTEKNKHTAQEKCTQAQGA